jgi:hypothetical protein
MLSNSKGKVPVWLIVVGGIFSVILIFAFAAGAYLLGIYNTCITYERELDNVYKQNQSVLSNSFYGPLQTAGIAEQKYKDAVATMARVGVEGWKGATGGKAMMLWLQESFPKIDPEIYKKLIDIGERGLGKFEKVQTDLLDRGRSYQTYLGIQPQGFFCKLFGFPKIDLKKILTPVTDESTDKSFETKQRVKPEF